MKHARVALPDWPSDAPEGRWCCRVGLNHRPPPYQQIPFPRIDPIYLTKSTKLSRVTRASQNLGYCRREDKSIVYLWPGNACKPPPLLLIRLEEVYPITDITDAACSPGNWPRSWTKDPGGRLPHAQADPWSFGPPSKTRRRQARVTPGRPVDAPASAARAPVSQNFIGHEFDRCLTDAMRISTNSPP